MGIVRLAVDLLAQAYVWPSQSAAWAIRTRAKSTRRKQHWVKVEGTSQSAPSPAAEVIATEH